jgi:hypothetical protein
LSLALRPSPAETNPSSRRSFKELGLYNKYLGPIPDRPLTDDNMSLEARRFLRFLVESHVANRPTADQALAHEWMLNRRGTNPFLRELRTVYLIGRQPILEIFFSSYQTYLIVVTKHRVTVVPVAPGNANASSRPPA